MDSFQLLIYALAAIGFVVVLAVIFISFGFLVLMAMSRRQIKADDALAEPKLTPKHGSPVTSS